MKYLSLALLLLCGLQSCKKQEQWLDVKSNRSDVTPTTLKDFQALLDNNDVMNDTHPGMPIVSSDNYYVTYNTWLSETSYARNLYIWKKDDLYMGFSAINDWNGPYTTVEYANIVLEGIQKITQTPANQLAWNNCRGSALFYRAFAFFSLVNVFAKPYDAATASTDPGIPIRLSADVNERSVRASVADTYTRILTDLKEALTLLPDVPQYKTRPGALAVQALLARVYMAMGDYANAGAAADKVLSGPYQLLDYNTVSTTASYPMPNPLQNNEILFFARGVAFSFAVYFSITDSTLLASYTTNDLRKTAFYNSAGLFDGGYTQLPTLFAGFALNEIYLIRAEASARAGNAPAAMQDLNTLLQKRWKSGTYVNRTAANATDALDQVLTERRKELPFTGMIRWMDLRRLNTDSRYAVTQTRLLNGQAYTLPPNDLRYVLPIPEIEIRISGIEQNPR